MKKTTGFSETKKQKTTRVDEMLCHLIRARTIECLRTGKPPVPMSLKQIADYCGVDVMVIHRAERSGMKKIRRMTQKFQKELEELV